MRIALISDIHANLPALQTVIEHARQAGCEEFWNLGDNVGYGPFPEETIQLVRELKGYSILGNYDRKVLAFRKKKKSWRHKKNPLKFLAFEWASENLSKASRRYLKSLTPGQLTQVDPFEILLTHGTPQSDEEVILPWKSGSRFEELGESSGVQVLLCGHTHVLFDFTYGPWRYINPGSVGRPGDGNTRTSYAILDFHDGKLSVRHYRLDYDLDPVLEAIKKLGLPSEFAEMIRQGRSLDDLDGKDKPPSG